MDLPWVLFFADSEAGTAGTILTHFTHMFIVSSWSICENTSFLSKVYFHPRNRICADSTKSWTAYHKQFWIYSPAFKWYVSTFLYMNSVPYIFTYCTSIRIVMRVFLFCFILARNFEANLTVLLFDTLFFQSYHVLCPDLSCIPQLGLSNNVRHSDFSFVLLFIFH